jgi:hypothetical protein
MTPLVPGEGMEPAPGSRETGAGRRSPVVVTIGDGAGIPNQKKTSKEVHATLKFFLPSIPNFENSHTYTTFPDFQR